jgi:hypothetical protein
VKERRSGFDGTWYPRPHELCDSLLNARYDQYASLYFLLQTIGLHREVRCVLFQPGAHPLLTWVADRTGVIDVGLEARSLWEWVPDRKGETVVGLEVRLLWTWAAGRVDVTSEGLQEPPSSTTASQSSDVGWLQRRRYVVSPFELWRPIFERDTDYTVQWETILGV